MEQQMRQIINDIYSDLEAAVAECGETLCAESLADAVGDRMHDDSEQYRTTPYPKRRALVLAVCKQYV